VLNSQVNDLGLQAYRSAEGALAATPVELQVERIIRPATRRIRLRDLLREGPVIRVLAARDFRVKYKQSILGPVWLVVQPLALLAGFVIAFRGLAGVKTGGIPYLPFTLVALTAWAFFQSAIMVGTLSVVANSTYVRFTPCPRPAFPIAAVMASLPSFGITAAGALLATAISGHLSPRVLLWPLGLIWLTLLILGMVGISSALAVRYRDIVNLLPLALQLGLLVAPVGYPLSKLSTTYRTIVELNPVTGVMETFRWMVLSGYHPSVQAIVFSLVGTAIITLGSWRLFSRLEPTMADEI
jgi:lipopolysaccharide transport system permease protein